MMGLKPSLCHAGGPTWASHPYRTLQKYLRTANKITSPSPSMGFARKFNVTPAQAGVHAPQGFGRDMDSGFRRNDEGAEWHFSGKAPSMGEGWGEGESTPPSNSLPQGEGGLILLGALNQLESIWGRKSPLAPLYKGGLGGFRQSRTLCKGGEVSLH
jgi:hypothetical protein